MRVPIQAQPITRMRCLATPSEMPGISPQSAFCGICEDAISGILEVLVAGGCVGIDAGFEVACNALGDEIPIIGEGPWEIACAVAGGIIGSLCEQHGPQWLGSSAGVEAICSAMDFC
jgi:hypothetical protein